MLGAPTKDSNISTSIFIAFYISILIFTSNPPDIYIDIDLQRIIKLALELYI